MYYATTPLEDIIHLVLVHVQILTILPRTNFKSLQLQHNIAIVLLSTHKPLKFVDLQLQSNIATMPPKLEPDETMKFLYSCFKGSDFSNVGVINSSRLIQSHQTNTDSQIDWNVVGAANNLKPNAARMRFTRLRNAIDPPDGACNDANACETPTEGDSAETPTETPTKKTPKTPKKTPAKKTANNESPTKESPSKRKKKDESDDKPVKKARNTKAKTVKAETQDSEGIDAAVEEGDEADFHEAIDEVEMARNGAMVEA